MSIEYLIEKYHKLVYKICYDMLMNPLDAEDATQEVYINLYNSFDRYRELKENEQKNILCRIALNKCKDILKSKQKKLENITDSNELTLQTYAEEDNIEEDIIKEEKREYIIDAIGKLKEPYSNILYEYYIQEFTLDEIATLNNVEKPTLKMQLYRAKKKLKEQLEMCGGENLL